MLNEFSLFNNLNLFLVLQYFTLVSSLVLLTLNKENSKASFSLNKKHLNRLNMLVLWNLGSLPVSISFLLKLNIILYFDNIISFSIIILLFLNSIIVFFYLNYFIKTNSSFNAKLYKHNNLHIKLAVNFFIIIMYAFSITFFLNVI